MSEAQDRSPGDLESITDRFTEHSHQLVETWSARTKRNAALSQQGEYGLAHLLEDASLFWQSITQSLQYSIKAAELGLSAVMSWAQTLQPSQLSQAQPNPTTVSTTVSVPPATELHAGAFRAIGSGTQHWIHTSDVTIQRDPTDPTQITVTLSFENITPVEQARTIFYEGHVHDTTGAPVSDVIRIPKPAH